jgi:AcrR family transcriptional regulator
MRDFSMESQAKAAGVSRQTIHNLFRTRTGVLEALFDQIALDGGMQRMPQVMQQRDPDRMLAAFVEVFVHFWAGNRLLLRRIHGIAAVDPEFEAAVEARNRRRHMAATRVVERLGAGPSQWTELRKTRAVALLVSLTSFEFFDVLAENSGGSQAASALMIPIIRHALMSAALEPAEEDNVIDLAASADLSETH